MKPDGSDPEIVSFVFGKGSVTSHTLDPGPDGEDGIELIYGGTIDGEEYLFIGPSKSGGNIDYIYYWYNEPTYNCFSAELPRVNILIPSDKAIPVMVVFDGSLYIARNTKELSNRP